MILATLRIFCETNLKFQNMYICCFFMFPAYYTEPVQNNIMETWSTGL